MSSLKVKIDRINYNDLRTVLNRDNTKRWDNLSESQKKEVRNSLLIIYSRLGCLPTVMDLNRVVGSLLSNKDFFKFCDIMYE